MKIGVSLSEELIAFADEAAKRQGTSRSGLLARLLEAERIRQQASAYLDRHGWDIAEDDEAWREYQRNRMAADYADDEW
jgi:metal-responsive CopG/Arc/MetJ family transcriptional regulator